MSFKVGDIVTGKPDNGYTITTIKSKCRVINVYAGLMEVEVLEHPTFKNEIGNRFTVHQNRFSLAGVAKFTKENLNALLLNELTKNLTTEVIGHDVKWYENKLEIGCSDLPKKKAVKIAKEILAYYGEEV